MPIEALTNPDAIVRSRAERAAQGLPTVITDRAALAHLAVAMRAAHAVIEQDRGKAA